MLQVELSLYLKSRCSALLDEFTFSVYETENKMPLILSYFKGIISFLSNNVYMMLKENLDTL